MRTDKTAGCATELAQVRQEILTYCGSLPSIIATHGRDSLGWVALNVGKCFVWIGPTLDRYNLPALPGTPHTSVANIGDQLRVIGLEMIHKPLEGELQRTIDTLTAQLDLLKKLDLKRHRITVSAVPKMNITNIAVPVIRRGQR